MGIVMLGWAQPGNGLESAKLRDMNEPANFSVESEHSGGATRLTLNGELDLASLPLLERAVSAVLERPLQR